ncbi:MAG: hypothetical protein WBB69_16185 [Anaerolineales bacterium]
MKRMLCILIGLALLAGCIPQQESQPNLDQFVIETLVAATLTAEASNQDGSDKPTDTETPPQDETTQPQLPSPTATETPTPTFTLTPTPTETPETVPGDPVTSLGPPSFKDTFENDSNFYTYDEASSSFEVDEDQFILIAKKANSYETWSVSWRDLTNFYLEITGTFGEQCGGKDRYGLIFRAPDSEQGYLLSITCDGSFRLSAYEKKDKEYTTIQKWTASEYINTGPGATNRLGIKAKGSKLTGFINGHQVFEKSSSMFSKGRFGVLVAAAETPGFTAYLTQAVYWILK